MAGRVCLVTGATGGIGLEAAKALARQGATLVLVGRDAARGEAALQAVRDAAPGVSAELLLADLSRQKDVRALAAAFLQRHEALHVLLNNAGAIYEKRQVTEDGLEATFATNHLSYFLLTHLLRGALEAGGDARIVNVASRAHQRARLDLDDLQAERRYSGMRAYANSKLANILFTQALARRLRGGRVTANSLHPGVVRTGFGRNNAGAIGHVFRLFAPFFLTPEEGAKTSVYLASSPEVSGVSGEYFARCRRMRPSRAAQDEALAEKLWAKSAQLTGVAP
ncbi:SDR family oxidoreductase [Aggregicoccus sp. 17bor-14]|nr:SDR family oxidoreductase [Simulacricoccus sp. 17bor-14]MRI88781.1 SDR family oxidoreductase [Aggregicoccus sp. 17bor-14]